MTFRSANLLRAATATKSASPHELFFDLVYVFAVPDLPACCTT